MLELGVGRSSDPSASFSLRWKAVLATAALQICSVEEGPTGLGPADFLVRLRTDGDDPRPKLNRIRDSRDFASG